MVGIRPSSARAIAHQRVAAAVLLPAAAPAALAAAARRGRPACGRTRRPCRCAPRTTAPSSTHRTADAGAEGDARAPRRAPRAAPCAASARATQLASLSRATRVPHRGGQPRPHRLVAPRQVRGEPDPSPGRVDEAGGRRGRRRRRGRPSASSSSASVRASSTTPRRRRAGRRRARACASPDDLSGAVDLGGEHLRAADVDADDERVGAVTGLIAGPGRPRRSGRRGCRAGPCGCRAPDGGRGR